MFFGRRNWLQVLLVAVLLLAACGGGQQATQTEEVPGTGDETGTEIATVAATEAMTEEPTEAATEAMTEEPTEEVTEAATEEATEAATEEATEAATAEGTEEATAGATEAAGTPGGGLISAQTEEAPALDGSGDDAAWENAQELQIPVAGGANNGSSTVTIKSVHDGENVYFLVTWSDPTQSWLRVPWEKQADGTWAKQNDPNDKGGDNNLYYEDKISFIWPINNSIPNFETQGCFTACHAGENSDVKPFGNKYTSAEGQTGDIWHWKSVRNLNQVDDQFLDHVKYSADTPEAGRHSDPNTGGGYVNNETEDQTMPAFMQPEGGDKDGSPGFILDTEKVPFDDSLFEEGDLVPGVVISEIQGDRGNISAGWQYADGAWTLEFSRPLTTDSEFDVQFDDLSATYYFGVATFDNAQVRHAFQNGATAFTFEQ